MKFLNLLPVLLLFVTVNLSAQNEPYDSRAWFEKAKQHLANDHLKDAIKEYSKISVSDSLYPEIVTPLSYCLLGTKQEDKAIEILHFAIKNMEDLNIHAELKEDDEIKMIFKSSYELVNNELIVNIEEFNQQIEVSAGDYNPYREVINSAADFNKVVLILEQD